jgi:copper chaperone CopZ
MAIEEKTLKVRGMISEHCARAISNTLENNGGAMNIKIDMKYDTVSFSYDPKLAPLNTLINLIIDEGFDVVG